MLIIIIFVTALLHIIMHVLYSISFVFFCLFVFSFVICLFTRMFCCFSFARQTLLFSATLPKLLVDFTKAGIKTDSTQSLSNKCKS